MKRTILSDHGYDLISIGEDRRPRDRDGWPMVTVEDWRALLGLLCLIGIVIAICAVDPTGQAGR